MSEQKSGLGMVALGVAALGLVGLISWDQMRQHARPAAPKVATRQIQAEAAPVEPTEATDNGAALEKVPAAAPADTTGESDRNNMPAGEVLTI